MIIKFMSLSGASCDIESKDVSGSNCTNIPMTQGLSEPCCPSYGIDACGAGLFCAAFDGRKQATCYPERSRPNMTECFKDIHCMSGECNTKMKACKSLPNTKCTGDIDCAKDPLGNRYVCDIQGKSTCEMVRENGNYNDPCEYDSDCKKPDLKCEKNRCKMVLVL
jgi:hypothetical protein